MLLDILNKYFIVQTENPKNGQNILNVYFITPALLMYIFATTRVSICIRTSCIREKLKRPQPYCEAHDGIVGDPYRVFYRFDILGRDKLKNHLLLAWNL